VRRIAQTNVAHWNPVLHHEGEMIGLFYKVGPSVYGWKTHYVTSNDGGLGWRMPRELVTNEKLPRGPVKNRIIRLSNGDWLAPGSIEKNNHWETTGMPLLTALPTAVKPG